MSWGLPGGPAVKTLLPLQGAQVGSLVWELLGGASGKEPTCECGRQKRLGFDPWVRNIPWSRKR